ncbi:TetR/AcrR family transcriptional regulator [Glutamicibacter endophyticus]|uniref:TetR/AcrR family transcriptional regulator n=1 Tax=Glutamicibacter endophyticus TaxID=1522174 RepID=UPI003AF187FF
MPRVQEFERDAVVRAARGVFWEQGFENASIPALERATGLSRSSLYNEFGSKRGLFDAAVQSYLEEVLRPRLAALQTDPVNASALGDYLESLEELFADPDSLPTANGCLLINTAGAPMGHDEHIAEVIGGYRDELYAAVLRGVCASRPEVEERCSLRMAEAITGLIIAAYALIRITPAQAQALLRTARELLVELSGR